MRDNMLKVYAVAILLGIMTGMVGAFFQQAIHVLSLWLATVITCWGQRGGSAPLLSALVTMGMALLAYIMVKWFAPEAAGSGVQEVEGALLHERPVAWKRVLPVKFVGGVLAISSKLVLGREGPTIQMGANIGEMVGQWFNLPRQRIDALIAAGAAAGLAAAFNAPLAGVLFVLEEMRSQFNFSFTHFSAVTIACVVATIVLHCILGASPAIPMAVFSLPSNRSLILFFIFGLVIGLLGLLFNILLMKSLYLIDKGRAWHRYVYVILVGLFIGYLGYAYPDMVGGGYNIIERSLTMYPSFRVLIFLILIRFIMTLLCYNTGVPGGIFAPMLALGTLVGLASSHVLQWIMTDVSVHPGMFAVAGMGAFFAAAVRAPITGIVLVVEMTHNYMLILPLMVTCLTATIVVQLANNPPIYTQLLERTLKRTPNLIH